MIVGKYLKYYGPQRKLFAADMSCALMVAVCNMFYPMLTRNMINKYVPQQNLYMILISGGILLLIYLIKAALMYFIQYYGHVMGVHIQCDIRRDAFNHLQRLPFSYFDRTRSGSIMSRIINDTMDISELAHHGPEDLFISVTTILGAFVILARISLPLTLIIFALLPVLVVFAARKRIKLSKTSMKTRVEIGEVNADLENSIAGVRVAKAYGSSSHELDKFQQGSDHFAKARGKQYKAMAEFFSGTGLIMDILVLVTLFSGGLFTLYGKINIGDLTAYLLFVGLFTDPIKRLINFIEQLQAGLTGLQRIQELMEIKPEQDSENARELREIKGDILFDDITFQYDEGQKVLRGLTMSIKAGETVALVGPSGGGKSTLCHLLPRFYEVENGRILLDGVDIREYTRLSLRNSIGIVQQDTFLFTGSIRDNIAYGNFNATDDEIIAAAKAADIHSFIDNLPDKYDTFVGERGVMLSGGQKQRVSIARIFLKNPPILILDEATSALDNTTEIHIQQSLDDLSSGRTTLVVAHRLSTIRNANRIVVIDNNRIAEEGTHRQLLERKGIYAELWAAQVVTGD